MIADAKKERHIGSDKLAAKFAARRVELARAALSTLSQLGYARSSLREIAQNSKFSHGVLHYYFKDKTELIICSIREFKIDSIQRFAATLAPARDLPTLLDRMDQALAAALLDDGESNRLWYDLRAQAMFDTQFRGAVLDIYAMLQAAAGRILDQIHDVTGIQSLMSPEDAYAIFDGLFQRCMLRHAGGEPDALPELQGALRTVVLAVARRAIAA